MSSRPRSPRILTAIPVYNEERHVLDVLHTVREWCDDILVVDDGSSDRTPLLLQEMVGISVIRHNPNQGYGGALRSAFQFAIEHDYDVLVTIDCDGQHQPQFIPEMAAAVYPPGERSYDIVSGSRYLKTFDGNSLPPEERRSINMHVNRRLESCYGLTLTDSFCGFKAYRVEALKKFEITELGYALPLQLWVQAVRHRMRIREFAVPLIYTDEERSFGESLDVAATRLAYYEEVLKREMELQNAPCGSNR
ncbi:MAG: glycosyltransferase family 2 protein [Planctomycetaceae bacterium]|nr:glycosyltransferase family 2 protein [Planctomycetaceae bacterium]